MARILLIEDERDIVHLMKMLLEYGNHEVLIAMDGEEGLAMARKELPDLILMDILLPKMDGYAINKELLRNEKTRMIPVIVVTTQMPKESPLISAPNVKCYLQKPFDMTSLLDKIQQVLDSKTPKAKS